MSTPLRPRTVFAQVALVIVLTLAGAAVWALLLGRELGTRPIALQALRAMDGLAHVVEALERGVPRGDVIETLQAAGLEVREAPPDATTARTAARLRDWLSREAQSTLGERREIAFRDSGDGTGALWIKLDTATPLWVSFARPGRGELRRTWSVLTLVGTALLVWAGAAYGARRLVLPLQRLARAAPGVARGDPPPANAVETAPREVVALAQALAAASAEVRAAAQERSLMLAGISHDLRTPLTRLQYALELLPNTDPELHAGIVCDIEEIDRVLAQFIAYARDGRDEPEVALDLADICRGALAGTRPDWQVDLPETAPMHGRPTALLRAVGNLLTNAERHAAPPFGLSLARSGEHWVLEISDGGSGLPTGQAERLRQPFVRSGQSGGSGLGLAIVERVAQQHGGTLELLPRSPHGLRAMLRLSITLPWRCAPQPR